MSPNIFESNFWISFRSSFSRLANEYAADARALENIVARLEADRFYAFLPEGSDTVEVVFHSAAGPKDMLSGYVAACFTALGYPNVEQHAAAFLRALKENGWSTEYLQLRSNGWSGQRDGARPKSS